MFVIVFFLVFGAVACSETVNDISDNGYGVHGDRRPTVKRETLLAAGEHSVSANAAYAAVSGHGMSITFGSKLNQLRTDIQYISRNTSLMKATWSTERSSKPVAMSDRRKLSTDLVQLLDGEMLPSSTTLRHLKNEMMRHGQLLPAGAVFRSEGTEVPAPDDLVHVYVYLNSGKQVDDAMALLWHVSGASLKYGIVVAHVEVSKLTELAMLPAVRTVRPVVSPEMNSGSLETEGDAILGTDMVRGMVGINGSGAGVKIGVISNGVDTRRAAQLSGDLPEDDNGLTVLRNAYHGDEGTAMLEIIHDIVPDAELYFHDCGTDILQFTVAIDALADAGCDIIVDDVAWRHEPFFDEGTVGGHVAELLDTTDVIYVTSAGNKAQLHYQGVFADGTQTGFHEFEDGEIYILAHVPEGGSIYVVLQWDEAYGAATEDYNICLVDDPDGAMSLLGCSSNVQDGTGDPLEYIEYTNSSSDTVVGVMIDGAGAKVHKEMEIFLTSFNGTTVDNTYLTQSDSIYGHGSVPDVLTVGTIGVADIDTGAVQPFSSQGPVTLLDTIVQKPDLCGVDAVSVTGAGGFPAPFVGTSAAAPHIAAMAAQLLGVDSDLSREEVVSSLKSTAVDVGVVGFDSLSGHGRADAMGALKAVAGCTLDAECDDSFYCNGIEICSPSVGVCVSGVSPCNDDGTYCNGAESCDEGIDTCVSSGDPCGDDGVYCNGVESCDEGGDTCVSSGNPCGDDGLYCNGGESCDEGADTCVSSGNPCDDDGVYCNGVESCDEGMDACVSSGNPCGDDGVYCNGVESCDEGMDACVSSGNPCRDDYKYCTGVESCDEGADTCVSSGNPCVDDGVYCNGVESCFEGADTCVSSGNPCDDDGMYCNGVESCDEGADACVSSGNPCKTWETCNNTMNTCSYTCPGCLINGFCYADGAVNANNVCLTCNVDLSSLSWSSNDGAPCNDHRYCNGADFCYQKSCSVHDGSPCPVDDGLFCNGQEGCDEVADACLVPVEPCDSDDGQFCNGNDGCDESVRQCVHDGNPCESTEICDESSNTCELTCDGCDIGATCHADGDTNPLNECEICDSASVGTQWTGLSDVPCNDDNPCTQNDFCSRGQCAGELLADWTDCDASPDACFDGVCEHLPEGDACHDAVLLEMGLSREGDFKGYHSYASIPQTCGVEQMDGRDAYYRITLDANETYEVFVTGVEGVDVAFAVWSDCTGEDNCLDAVNDVGEGSTERSGVFEVEDVKEAIIQVLQVNNSSGDVSAPYSILVQSVVTNSYLDSIDSDLETDGISLDTSVDTAVDTSVPASVDTSVDSAVVTTVDTTVETATDTEGGRVDSINGVDTETASTDSSTTTDSDTELTLGNSGAHSGNGCGCYVTGQSSNDSKGIFKLLEMLIFPILFN